MASEHLLNDFIHPTAAQLALKTAALELRFQQSTTAIVNVSKDEASRRLRYQTLLLQDDVDELQNQVWEEADRSDDLHAQLEAKAIELRVRTRELDTFKTELVSLQSVSADSAKVLTDKLALARELAMLKPEAEDLRVQVSMHRNVYSEKLALQREVSSLKAELENKDRRLSLSRAREGRNAITENKAEAQIQLQVDELKANLVEERSMRQKLEKQFSKAEADWKAQKSVMEEKLGQFRAKLRANKDKLKNTEAELQKALCTAVASTSAPAARNGNSRSETRNPRKRGATAIDPDAVTGTPGDAGPAKRTKRAPSVLGGKSTFSVTPFLKRTATVAHGSPLENLDQAVTSTEELGSPTVARARAEPAVPKKVATSSILALSSPGKSNPKVAPFIDTSKPKAHVEPLVEDSFSSGNAVVITTEAPEPMKKSRPALRPKKSLVSFASFREGSAVPEKIKKRRALGGAKTLFDDGDDEGVADGGMSGGQRAFGAFGGRGLGIGLLGAKAGFKKGPLVTAGDGFTFSPLKRDRRAAAAAAAKEASAETG